MYHGRDSSRERRDGPLLSAFVKTRPNTETEEEQEEDEEETEEWKGGEASKREDRLEESLPACFLVDEGRGEGSSSSEEEAAERPEVEDEGD